MTKKSELIKKVVKSNVEEKPTFGTNPNDPWSTKANISESPLLNRYLKSRGINPEFVSKDQKVAHSKTNQFKTWMSAHVNDPVRESVSQEHTPTQKRLHVLKKAVHVHKEIRVADGQKKLHQEEADKKDTITMDIPLLIRVLEFAREDLKSDVNLHKMVERLISIRGEGTLTMDQYSTIVKEEFINEDLAGILARHTHHHTEMMKAMKSGDKTKTAHHEAELNKAKSDYAAHQAKASVNKPESAIAKDYKDQEKIRGIGHVRDHVEVDGETVSENRVVDAVKKAWKAVSHFDDPSPKYDGQTRRRQALKKKLGTDKKKVSEAKEANYGGDYQSTVLRVKAAAKKKPVDMAALAARMQASYKKDEKKGVKENLEPAAACNQPWDGANNPDDTIPAKRSTAKKVKLLLGGKKGQVKEEMYDHEKEDKPATPVGKKVKLQKPGVDAVTKESPQAAAILSGGKTLTGEPRDTIEIDPMMKMRKPSPTDSQKSS